MPGLTALNALPRNDARDAFLQCCASPRWAEAMLAGRPYAEVATLYAVADRTWRELSAAEWLEAFAAHPRIGERHPSGAAAPAGKRAAAWSAAEQSAAAMSDAEVASELARVNREYEERFGHVYLVCASGRSAVDLLAEAKRRVQNDARTELANAAEEQRKITRLRLARLVEEVG